MKKKRATGAVLCLLFAAILIGLSINYLYLKKSPVIMIVLIVVGAGFVWLSRMIQQSNDEYDAWERKAENDAAQKAVEEARLKASKAESRTPQPPKNTNWMIQRIDTWPVDT